MGHYTAKLDKNESFTIEYATHDRDRIVKIEITAEKTPYSIDIFYRFRNTDYVRIPQLAGSAITSTDKIKTIRLKDLRDWLKIIITSQADGQNDVIVNVSLVTEPITGELEVDGVPDPYVQYAGGKQIGTSDNNLLVTPTNASPGDFLKRGKTSWGKGTAEPSDINRKRTYGYVFGGDNTIDFLTSTEQYYDIGDVWSIKQSLNEYRWDTAGFSLNGYGYAAGQGWTYKDTVEKYNQETDTWTYVANLIQRGGYWGGFSLSGHGYIPGGYNDFGDPITMCQKYKDRYDIWLTIGNLSKARAPSAFSLNGYGYAIGGKSGFTSYEVITEQYDDIADTWTVKANLNNARGGDASFSLNGYGYVAGGYNGVSRLNSVERYDDIADTWTVKTNLSGVRAVVRGFSLNGYGYVVGGYDGSLLATTERYDDITDTWTVKANLNVAREEHSSFSIETVEFWNKKRNSMKYIRDDRLPTAIKAFDKTGVSLSTKGVKHIAFIDTTLFGGRVKALSAVVKASSKSPKWAIRLKGRNLHASQGVTASNVAETITFTQNQYASGIVEIDLNVVASGSGGTMDLTVFFINAIK